VCATRETIEVAPSRCDSAGVERDSGTVWYAHLLAPLRVARVSSVPRLLGERASSVAASLCTCVLVHVCLACRFLFSLIILNMKLKLPYMEISLITYLHCGQTPKFSRLLYSILRDQRPCSATKLNFIGVCPQCIISWFRAEGLAGLALKPFPKKIDPRFFFFFTSRVPLAEKRLGLIPVRFFLVFWQCHEENGILGTECRNIVL
jgi:hypothetical protein